MPLDILLVDLGALALVGLILWYFKVLHRR
jgi:hypothetical protein